MGADKPDPLIFRRGLALAGVEAEEALHVGDDPDRDWKAAGEVGLRVFRLHRPKNSLRDLLATV
jgi:putative hydrolase of the HAD superfamily